MIDLPQGSASSARHSRVLRSGAFGRDRPVEWHHLISQELFRDALVRERKRADRFEEAFVLVLISFNGRAARQLRWGYAVEALLQTKLDGDVIGWFEQGSVLGLIRSLADCDLKATATTLAGAVRAELARCLTPDKIGRAHV